MTKNFLLAFILFTATACAQTTNDSLWMEGSRIFHKDYEIAPGEALDIMTNSPDASNEMRKAISNRSAGNIFGFCGGLLIGFPLGQLIGGSDDPMWSLAAIGGGLIAAGIPFSIAYKTHARKAVSIYNSKNIKTSFWDIEINPEKICLVFRF